MRQSEPMLADLISDNEYKEGRELFVRTVRMCSYEIDQRRETETRTLMYAETNFRTLKGSSKKAPTPFISMSTAQATMP